MQQAIIQDHYHNLQLMELHYISSFLVFSDPVLLSMTCGTVNECKDVSCYCSQSAKDLKIKPIHQGLRSKNTVLLYNLLKFAVHRGFVPVNRTAAMLDNKELNESSKWRRNFTASLSSTNFMLKINLPTRYEPKTFNWSQILFARPIFFGSNSIWTKFLSRLSENLSILWQRIKRGASIEHKLHLGSNSCWNGSKGEKTHLNRREGMSST